MVEWFKVKALSSSPSTTKKKEEECLLMSVNTEKDWKMEEQRTNSQGKNLER
jgi:hypothetical protein